MKQIFLLTISLLTVTVFISVPQMGYCGSPSIFHKNITTAKKISKENSKVLLIYFRSSENANCKELEDIIFPDTEIQSLIESYYVGVSIEGNTYDGRAIMAVYGVKSLPAIVAHTNQGDFIGKTEGKINLVDLSSLLRKWNYSAMEWNKKEDQFALDIHSKSSTQTLKNTQSPKDIDSVHIEQTKSVEITKSTPKTITSKKIESESLFNNYWKENPESELQTQKTNIEANEILEESAFAIQMGAFGSYENAAELTDKIVKKAGLFSDIIVVNQNGKSLHKVITGSFHSKTNAEKSLQHLKSVGLNGFIVKSKS